jgi:predicted heme/steroid binding protein
MKNIKLIAWVLSTTLFVISCSKDKDNSEKGILVIKGTEYSLTQGIIEFSGQESGGGYLFDVVLGTAGIDFSNNSVEGKGDAFYLKVYSESADEITSGAYTLDLEETSVVSTFRGHIYIGYNAVTYGVSEYYLPISGTLQVLKEGDNYTLSVDYICNKTGTGSSVLESDISVSCNYSGQLLKIE